MHLISAAAIVILSVLSSAAQPADILHYLHSVEFFLSRSVLSFLLTQFWRIRFTFSLHSGKRFSRISLLRLKGRSQGILSWIHFLS